MSDQDQTGVKPEAKADDPLSALSPEARELFKTVNAGLLSALQKERDAHSAAEKKAEALEKAQQDAERQRLEKSQEFEKLYQATLTELTNLKPKAEQVEEYEKVLSEQLAAEIETLPDEFKDVIPDGLSTKDQLRWLAKNKSKFMKAEPFDIGAGKRGVKPDKKTELTPEEKELARRFGMSEEDYAKFK